MLTPTTPLVTDYLEFEKITQGHARLIEQAHSIFSIEPLSPESTNEWRVRYPDVLGTSYWYHCYYGRNRWYEIFHNAVDPLIRNRLVATAPGYVRCWEEWENPTDFINLLTTEFTPARLAMRFGSNLAALQVLADMWDHLQIRDKFTIQLQSPSRTASLYSATSLLNWPSLFAQEMSHLTLRQNEFASNRVNLAVARDRTLTKHWLKALSTYSKSLSTACQIRTLLLNHLKAHQAQHLSLIPRWKRESGAAKTAENPGTTDNLQPVPVPQSETIITSNPQLDLKVYLTKRPADDSGEYVVSAADPPLASAVIGNKNSRRKISVAVL